MLENGDKYMQEYLKFARHLAFESAQIINKYFRLQVNIDSKPDGTPVTVADREAEEKMRDLISKTYPSHGIQGEEFGIHNPGAEFQWVLDPIDGTKNFICGSVIFGTLIGLTFREKPLLGILNLPVLGQLLAGDNTSTVLNGKTAKVRGCKSLKESVLLVTDPLPLLNRRNFLELLESVNFYRGFGDCYGYYLLASGFADIMIDVKMSPWDIIPLIPVIRGAGGIITDTEGGNAETGASAFTAGPQLHPIILDMLSQV